MNEVDLYFSTTFLLHALCRHVYMFLSSFHLEDHLRTAPSLVWIMICSLFDTKPLINAPWSSGFQGWTFSKSFCIQLSKLWIFWKQIVQFRTNVIMHLNSLHAKIFKRNINMYLQFLPFLHSDMTQVVAILSHEILPSLYIQHHGCCWPGDARSQGIGDHDIDLVKSS